MAGVTDAFLIHLMREASGFGMMDCKAALAEARQNHDGDMVLALLCRRANQFAVRVGSRDPAVSDSEARRRSNLGHALGDRERMVGQGGAWAELDRLGTVSVKPGTSL